MTIFQNYNENFRYDWIRRQLRNIPHGWKILDAGAGEQPFRKDCTHLKYVSQDFSQYDGSGNGKGLQTGSWNARDVDIVCDITSIPMPDSSFDAILCSEVFEHIPEPTLALREFARLLRNGGRLILTAPFYSLTHFAPYHYCSGFNKYYFEYHLPRYGFRITEMTPNGNLFSCMAQDVSRLPFLFTSRLCKAISLIPAYCIAGLLRLMARFKADTSEIMCFGYQLCAEINKDVQSGDSAIN